MNYLEILDQIKTHVEALFRNGKDERLLYHNFLHTKQVVENAVKLANHYHLNDEDFFTVVAAGWFHDTGYLKSKEDHESFGAAIATEFLQTRNVPVAVIEQVKACIMATKMPQQPKGLLQEIVCDADLYHLGTDVFSIRNKTMKKEIEAFYGHPVSKDVWRAQNIKFLEGHQFHTAYAKEQLNQGKASNLAALVKKSKEEKDSMKEVKKEKNDRPEKGIETMFRITSGNHQRLSDMADNKAHIMISTNSIILSVILSILLRKLEDNPHLIIPTLLLLIICVVTMVFSILATRPTIPAGTFTAEDINTKRVNLLFFGNFYRMNLTDYENGMRKMMDDRDFLYGSLIKDLHSQGVVLGRKYRLLHIAYNVFMFGIVASVLAFIIAMVLVAL